MSDKVTISRESAYDLVDLYMLEIADIEVRRDYYKADSEFYARRQAELVEAQKKLAAVTEALQK